MIRLEERNWDRPTRRKDYSHIRFSRFPFPRVMSLFRTKCTGNGPDYRRSLSSPVKTGPFGGNAPVPCRENRVRTKRVSTWARFFVQNSTFFFLDRETTVISWLYKLVGAAIIKTCGLWDPRDLEDSLLDHRRSQANVWIVLTFLFKKRSFPHFSSY